MTRARVRNLSPLGLYTSPHTRPIELMKNIHSPLAKRRIMVWAAALIVTAGITSSALSAAHHRADVRRIQADLRLIDSATTQLAFH